MGLVAKSIRARSKVSAQAGPQRVDDWILAGRPSSYWASTRRPFPSLLLVAPLVMAYESGVLWLGGATPGGLRTGADTWMRQALSSLGLSDHWLLPLLLFLTLLTWQVVSFYNWRFSPGILAGMVIESVLWAVVLLGISRLIDFGFSCLDQSGAPLLAVDAHGDEPSISSLIGYLGAGVYEEALFRLMLVPVFFAALRLLQTPQVLASALAVTGSALLFALAHHAGSPGEPFTWFAFIFRWMAGVFFAWVFILRGFGIAVGTHTIYDILGGWIAWRM
jgi:hypothetical protein